MYTFKVNFGDVKYYWMLADNRGLGEVQSDIVVLISLNFRTIFRRNVRDVE
ncbi:hypothetical protein ASTA108788_09815 [Asticcacaulis taihuensis]|uniref:Uncharacterized protein n=1 Tax=Asticcacaulis taihuensis TaxID=260084 RepID=A0A1G4TLF4_9CAUL|nr:hypothetical protein SAMN02927928_3681 [Asticcacaulis taihuensis]